MSWAPAYCGIPWLAGGRARAGLDCWGLVRLVYGERLGIDLPTYGAVDAADMRSVAEMIAIDAALGPWSAVPAGEEREYDVVLMNDVIGGRLVPAHVGIVSKPGHLLHVAEGGVSHQVPFRDGPTWRGDHSVRFRVASLHRHVAVKP